MNVNLVAGAIVNTINNLRIRSNSVIIYDIDRTLLHDNGKPIVPIVWTYNYALCKGLRPVIITAREGSQENIEKTKTQLYDSGIRGYKNMYFRPREIQDVAKYKYLARKDIFEKGDEALISVGDMDWDIGLYGGFGFKIDY
jgi:hypothetical protein